MINVDESSLKSLTAPNAYIKRIQLRAGGLPTSARQFDGQALATTTRNFDGTVGYTRSKTNTNGAMSGATTVLMTVAIKDIINTKTKRATWLSSNTTKSQINLRVFISYNNDLTTYIVSNNIFDMRGTNIPPQFNKSFDWQEKIISLAQKTSTGYTTERNESTGNMIASKDYDLDFVVPYDNLQHLTCFVFCEIVEPNNKLSGVNPHSMIALENIIANGVMVRKSLLLQTARGQLWAGPFHTHENRTMEGAFHTPTTYHNFLTTTSVHNFKSMDLRNYEIINNLSMDISPPAVRRHVNYMDSYLTRTPDGSAINLCVVDMEKVLLNNSKWARVYQNAPREIKNKILNKSTITMFAATRDRVRQTSGLNILGSAAILTQDFDKENVPSVMVTSAEQGGILSASARYVPSDTSDNTYKQVALGTDAPGNYVLQGSVQEKFFRGLAQKRVFEITDGGVSRITDGLYQHSVTMNISDGAFDYLQERFTQLRNSVTALDQFISIVRQNKNYDYGADKIRSTFVDSLGRTTNVFLPAPIVCLALYLEVLDLLTDMTPAQKNKFAQDIYCSIDVANTNLSLLGEFRNQLDSLCVKFESIIRPQVYTAALKSGTRASSASRGARLSTQVTLNLTLQGIIDSNIPKDVGFSYLCSPEGDQSQTLTVATDTLRDNIDNQLSIFNGASYSPEDLEVLGFNRDEVTALNEESNKYTYISPIQLKMGRSNISLVNQKEEDYTAIKAVIQTVLNNSSVGAAVAYPSKQLNEVLSFNGTGASKERNEKIKDIYVNLAKNNKINVNSLDPDLGTAKIAGSSSEKYVGANNKFTDLKAADNLESSTIQTPKEQYADATSVLENVLSILDVSPYKDVTFGAAQLAQISFDLKKTNNFIDKRIKASAKNCAAKEASAQTIEKLKRLPVPVKKLTLSKDNVFADGISTNNDAQSSGFEVVLQGLRVIEYLSGYENNFMKSPRWIPLQDIDNIKSNVICRIRRYTDTDTQVGTNDAWSNIPVYNEYFILTPPGGAANRTARGKQGTFQLARAGQLGYERSSVLLSIGSSLTTQLIRLEADSVKIQNQIEYTSAVAPGAPTNFMGKITGLLKK
jgi:hypothetical protein